MEKKLITEKSKIYVLCPAYSKTGGPELLHQLVNELNNIGIEAYITYYNLNKNNANYTDDDFKKYITTYKTINDIEDKKYNIIIVPEGSIGLKISKKVKNTKKIIWWLSVYHFDKTYGIKNTLKNFGIKKTFTLMIKQDIIYNFSYLKTFYCHFCQSHYAMNYLKNHGINNPIYLSDYINDDYLKLNENWKNKEDIILYNPIKGQEFTKRIIKNAPHLNFIPIQNLTTKQVKELLLKSKVYIDFGHHPGKDRIPREAAMCGCCVITSKKGSAKYYEDVPISPEFKFEDNNDNIKKIIDKLTECVENYDEEIVKFKDYRQFIKHEKEQFKLDVKNIFQIRNK